MSREQWRVGRRAGQRAVITPAQSPQHREASRIQTTPVPAPKRSLGRRKTRAERDGRGADGSWRCCWGAVFRPLLPKVKAGSVLTKSQTYPEIETQSNTVLWTSCCIFINGGTNGDRTWEKKLPALFDIGTWQYVPHRESYFTYFCKSNMLRKW